MEERRGMLMLVAVALAVLGLATPIGTDDEPTFTETFRADSCKLRSHGRNDFFPPVPGYCLLLEGEDEGESVKVLIKVLKKRRTVDGVGCRVVRETEWVNDGLADVPWNYYAFCRKHRGVFYYGEDVDIYEDGEVVSHEGAWLAGVNGAKRGLMMPGYPLVGSRYYQEMAPGVAMDRAEHKSVTTTLATPAGEFENCLLVEETTPLEPGETSVKVYAPGVGMVQDDALLLVEYGFGIEYEPEEDREPDGDD
jgi:hypothetical protein